MHDALAVCRFERVRHSNSSFEKRIETQRPTRDEMPQCRPAQQLHRNERHAGVFVNIVDRADVRMVQRRSGLRLALEALERCSVMRHALRQKLQRHLPLQLRVIGAIYHAHSAAPEPFDDAVVGDRLSDE